jgi:SPP1 gp7 family putative phage head morphogenesis protein
MSTHEHSSTDTLASYTRPRDAYGPARIKTATIRFEQNLRGVLQRINAALKEAIIEDDIFGLEDDGTDTLAVDDPPRLQTESNARKTVLFIQWLREQLNTELLEIVTRNENAYIRSAYAQGIRAATSALQEQGVDPATVDISELVEQGNFNRGLQTLFNRTYEELKGMTDDLVQEVRQELMEGFSRGENPRKVARRISDRVDSVGKHRATLIARTETLNAHSTGYLDRVEDVSDEQDTDIVVSHEWATAGDDRVCPICKAIDGIMFTTEEMREGTFELGGNTWQLKPPAHPMGRCTLLPTVGVSPEDLPPLDERLPDEPADT